MASSGDPNNDQTYTKMTSFGDVEAIGSHCQMPFCRQLDFLPFQCESCKGSFCLDHRTESAHTCPKEGEWARRRAQLNNAASRTGYAGPVKPNILTHEQQCSSPSCKTLINTPLVTGVRCARPATGPTQREKGLQALEKLKAWGAAKKKAAIPVSSSKKEAAARVQETANLKKSAKGDDKIAVEKRVYLYVEASSDTISAKIPKGTFFYNGEYTVGRILDLAAKSLQVSNMNNMSDSEEDKLRVFHVEGGRLLGFGEKLGKVVQSGNTVVLLRGVGAGMAAAP
ncbi:hypothetical protein LTR17_014763 [Elasticomyces elasticus]|nr:hypothetical protein LTR17_014763 [Elasticomyces elasticus]